MPNPNDLLRLVSDEDLAQELAERTVSDVGRDIHEEVLRRNPDLAARLERVAFPTAQERRAAAQERIASQIRADRWHDAFETYRQLVSPQLVSPARPRAPVRISNIRRGGQRREYLDYVREAARNNIYLKKPCSRFVDKCGNLPLDLWDSTPDP